jgi:hypothetical protein
MDAYLKSSSARAPLPFLLLGHGAVRIDRDRWFSDSRNATFRSLMTAAVAVRPARLEWPDEAS